MTPTTANGPERPSKEQSPESPGAKAGTWPAIANGRIPLRRILVVQTQRLGDVLCATPLFTALRNQFPQAHLAALVHHPLDVLLENSPDLDQVLTYDRQTTHRSVRSRLRFAHALRDQGFDWVLSIHAAGSVAFALVQARIPWRTCVWRYANRRKPHWARWFHQHVRQDRLQGARHEIEHNLDVLRELGIQPRHEGYRVCLRSGEREAAREWLRERGRDARPLAVVHPGHGGGRQSWPAEQYAAVAHGLVERGFQIAVTGSGGELPLVERVVAGMRGRHRDGLIRAPAPDGTLLLAGGMDLRRLAAVLGEASLFVSVSTGPMHLASAMGVPAVTLYGPTELLIESTRFCPYGSPHRAVLSNVPCTCPHSKDCVSAVCMTGIQPGTVLATADDLLRSL
jgi:heptosyltransferase III